MTARLPPRNPLVLPTLTEVLDLPVLDLAVESAPPPEPPLPAEPVAAAALPVHEIVEGVLAELGADLDSLLEQRLRETISPALARAADALVLELRTELAADLAEAVRRSVLTELERRRDAQSG